MKNKAKSPKDDKPSAENAAAVGEKTTKAASKVWIDPISRPIVAASVPGSGVDAVVEPTAAELQALTRALGLNRITNVKAEYRLARRSGGIIVVEGQLKAVVSPTCVITAEPFELKINEPVSLRFAEPAAHERRPAADDHEALAADDPPDEIENGMIDLGRVTTEFLSLAIPPFPRAPGATLEAATENGTESPFAALSRLKP